MTAHEKTLVPRTAVDATHSDSVVGAASLRYMCPPTDTPNILRTPLNIPNTFSFATTCGQRGCRIQPLQLTLPRTKQFSAQALQTIIMASGPAFFFCRLVRSACGSTDSSRMA